MSLSARRSQSRLRYRDRHGKTVTVREFTATEAKQEFGQVLEAVQQNGVVAITKHDAIKAVVLSVEEFQRVVGANPSTLDTLSAEFDDLLARMQAPGLRARMQQAFDASPDALGTAAVRAATKAR